MPRANLIALILLCALRAWAQEGPAVSIERDTLRAGKDTLHAPGDTLRAGRDTLRAGKDTLAARADTLKTSGGIDTTVVYSSNDSVVYDLSSKVMSLYSKGDIAYRTMDLKADKIDINWSTSVMNAQGVPDTSDTTGKKLKGLPIMKDGGEEYHGSEMDYNFKSKRGRINVANTTIDQGYYHGETIKKVEKDVMFVEDGRYTTCDAPEPHYFFFSPKMKVVPGDQIVAEPVYLYIADVPIFALPFGVFPNQRGRRSGIIAPAYGEDPNRGRYLTHLGYYFALSDYIDLALRSDLYTKGGWAAASDIRYALRYDFTGAVSLDYKRLHTGEQNDPDRTEDNSYRAHITHSQEIDPRTRLSADFTFASDNSYRTTNDLNQALNQFITSNATLSHSFDDYNSMGLTLGRNQNLQNGYLNETLPAISFSHAATYPLRWGKRVESEEDLPWYQMISLSYGANSSNTRVKNPVTVDSVRSIVGGVTTIGPASDFSFTNQQSLNQSVSMNFAPKLGYFTIAPFVNYNDSRQFTKTEVPALDRTDSSIVVNETKTSSRAGTISSGISASTRLYGIVQPGFFGVAALRHTMTPSLTLSYNKQIIGPDPVGRQMLLGFNLGNLFEMKTMPSGDSKEGNKIQLMNVNAGITYNFSADSLRFSELHTTYYTKIGSAFDVNGDASFNLYKLEEGPLNTYRTVNKFLLTEEGRLARLTSFRLGVTTSFSGEQKSSKSGTTQADSIRPRTQIPGMSYNPYEQEDPDFSIPWQLSFSFNYAENKVPPLTSHSINMNGHLEFNLTPNWKFSMQSSYDALSKQFLAPQINVSRDLHCWIMNFTWVPTGTYRHYQLEIRVKAPQLRDLKVTKSGSDRGIY